MLSMRFNGPQFLTWWRETPLSLPGAELGLFSQTTETAQHTLVSSSYQLRVTKYIHFRANLSPHIQPTSTSGWNVVIEKYHLSFKPPDVTRETETEREKDRKQFHFTIPRHSLVVARFRIQERYSPLFCFKGERITCLVLGWNFFKMPTSPGFVPCHISFVLE